MLPEGEKITTCQSILEETDNTTSYHWDNDVSKFDCMETIRYGKMGYSK